MLKNLNDYLSLFSILFIIVFLIRMIIKAQTSKHEKKSFSEIIYQIKHYEDNVDE